MEASPGAESEIRSSSPVAHDPTLWRRDSQCNNSQFTQWFRGLHLLWGNDMTKFKQQGMTGIGWLIVLGLVGFFSLAAIRVVPIYMEAFKVRGSLKSLAKEPELSKKSKLQIAKLVQKRFDIEDITSVSMSDIAIDKSTTLLVVAIDYEIRQEFMGNLDVVARFTEKVEVPLR